MEVSQIVQLLGFEEVGLAYLKVRSTAVEEDADVVQAQKLRNGIKIIGPCSQSVSLVRAKVGRKDENPCPT